MLLQEVEPALQSTVCAQGAGGTQMRTPNPASRASEGKVCDSLSEDSDQGARGTGTERDLVCPGELV